MSESPDLNVQQPSETDAKATIPGRQRWLKRVLAVVVMVATVLLGMLWWQERQLCEAAIALEKGDAKYAMYLVTRVLQRNPNNTRALAIQARGFVDLGYSEDAIKIFDHIGAASAEDTHALAKAFMMRQEWSSAEPLLIRVLQITPNDADVLYELTSCQMRLGRFKEALENAQLFRQASGQFARADLLIGSTYGAMRNYHEAAKAFERVFKKEPEGKNLQISSAEFFLRYGRVLMELGRPQDALMPLKLSAAGQENGEVFVLLGDAASQLGKPKNAVAAWKKAVEVDPKNSSARASLANAALLAGDGKQARQWLEPLRDGKLSSAVAYLFQRTFTLLRDEQEASVWKEKTAALRREESVIAVLDNALVSDPNAFWSRATRAHYFASEGNWAQAELIVSQLVKEQPGEPFVIELADAVRRKSELPALTRIPVVQF